MADTTKIEWTDSTWNPITGCTLVDDGCRNCYAAELAATRLKSHPSRAGLARKNAAGVAKFTGEVRLNAQWLTQPLHWRKPRMIFVCAHGDLFHEGVPDDWIDRVFAVIALCPQHTFQVLTKRPERAREYFDRLIGNEDRCRDVIEASRKSGALLGDLPDLRDRLVNLPLPNVWLGTSVSDQASADARIPELLATPAAVRFLSAEPLLGPVSLEWLAHDGDGVIDALRGEDWIEADGPLAEVQIHGQLDICALRRQVIAKRPTLDWVIVGGESGRNARPMHPDWARSLRDQCQAAGVAFFFKQWGTWDEWGDRAGKKAAGRLLDGRQWNEVPG
ncbi:phage Gp37/Gp68 family protein [Marinovum algicola]|uniref:phage Gp37/Gp68 family protein n=1 Tax=Marinovum algicola TaxID=42444 RepID=UPI00352A82E9